MRAGRAPSLLTAWRTSSYRLGELNNVKKQREEACYRFEADTWKGVQWMRANKDRFKGPVYEPARLNVFAKTRDTELVKLIEGPITMNAFKVRLYSPAALS